MREFKYLTICVLTFITIISCGLSEEEVVYNDQVNFNFDFKIQKMTNEVYELDFTVALDSGYYFVSPYSEGHHQRLIFSIDDTDSLVLNDDLVESPKAMETYDDLSNKRGRFVRRTTSYKQVLVLNTENDFEVLGLIWFELRPTNQPYEIEFIISQKSRKIEVNRTEIRYSNYPAFWDLKRLD